MALPNTLFHYTENLNTVFSILLKGFWPKYSSENIEWLGYSGDQVIGFPMVCFCDIPLSQIKDHNRIFGFYGIGLTRQWAESKEISPVHYVKRNSLVSTLYQGFKASSSDQLRKLASYVQNYEYISESEWRYVPDIEGVPAFVIDKTLENPERLAFFNSITNAKAMLHFSALDVDCVVVKYEAEVLTIQHWLILNFGTEIATILGSKVISCEMSGSKANAI